MIRFVHVADLHFGVENYGRIDPKTGVHTRLLDFKSAFDSCIDRAVTDNVDFFLFCGDAYKTAFPTPTQQRLLLDSFLKLFRANIPVVIIVGNHDNPASFGKTHALDLFGQLPVCGFTVIEKPSIVTLETKNGPINIVGIPWPNRSHLPLNNQVSSHPRDLADAISSRITKIISTLAERLDPQQPAVLAAHLTVSNGLFSGSERRAVIGNDPIFLPSQLAVPPFDYVALGHLHRHQRMTCGNTEIVYPGSIERIDFGELRDEKGFCLVTIDKNIKDGKTATSTFVPVTTRPFIEINLTLNTEENQTATITAALKKYDLVGAIVKIVYRLPVGVPDRIDLRAIMGACALAHDIIGIIPIRQIGQRAQRASIATDASLSSALKSYCATKNISEPQQRRLELLLHKLEEDSYLPSMPLSTQNYGLQRPPAPPSPHPDLLGD